MLVSVVQASVELDKPLRIRHSEYSHLLLRSSRKIRIRSNTKGTQTGGFRGTSGTLAVAAA